jgi:putative flippase GtrA
VTGDLQNFRVSGFRSASFRTAVSFLAVGGISSVAYSVLCTWLVKALPGYPLAISIGVHACLIPFAFFGQRLAFASSGAVPREFFRYAGLQIASISFSALTLSRLIGRNEIQNLLVFLSISALAAVVSFLICSFYIFQTPDPTRKPIRSSAPEDDVA